jgi:methionine-rich copper-binding protein CopC
VRKLAAISGLAAMAGSVMAQITVVNTGSVESSVADDPKTALLSFNAGATANKLIVHVSAEGQDVASITYQGVALSQAVAGTGRNLGIFYLDTPFTGGAADLSVTLAEGISNGIAVGVVSVSGAAPGVAAAALADAASSVTLTVPVSGSFVVGGYADHGTGTITLPAGHTALYNSTDIGSAHAAASYANSQTAGSRTYSFTDTSPSFPATSAAVFVPASAAPVVAGTSPAAAATAVQPDSNLVATFSEAVVAGSGNIELWQSGGISPIESFNVVSSPQITIAGSTLTIDPSANLSPDAFYYVLIASTAVVDTSGGNAFAGIASPSVWSFSTGSNPPLVPTFSSKDNAFGVALNANLVATFSETIQKGTGNVTIHRADGTVFETINVTTSAVTLSGGKVTINPVNNLVAGAGYYVLIDSTAFRNTANQFYAGISDPTVWNFTALPDLATVDGRLTWMMQQNITNPSPITTTAAGLASYALAAFHLGTDLVTANDYINQFHDQYPVPDSDNIGFSSYFWLHLIWRIYHDPTMNARLTPLARTNIENMMWSFIRTRSRTSDAQGDTWVYHGSENHDAMQKGSYLLCAEALKDAPGYGSGMVLADGQTLAQHAMAWSGYFQRYFTARAGEGINAEIASPIYAKYSVGVYYNLMDFAESPVLRTLAQRFITLYWADTASDWTLSGVRGGGETRCYKENYLRLGSQYSFQALLYGYGWHANASPVRAYGLIPAASSYRVPAILNACATDSARPNYLYTSRRFGRAGSVVGDDNFFTFDSGNSNLRSDTWVTPDYTMGSLTFDMNRDYTQISDQNRVMGVMFASGPNNRVMVFGKGASTDNKSYADLSGVTRADCMVVQRDQNANRSGSGTLVFVPQTLWDARVETSGWLFLQSGNAYCAVRPAGGTYSATTAAHGVDLSMSNIWAPVIIQTGQAANYANFAAFEASVIANALTFSSNILNYTSEAGDTFTFYANSKTTPRVNGATVNLNPTKTYDSPYLSMVHGTDLATVSYPGYEDLLLSFDPTSTSFITVNASAQAFQSASSLTNTLTGFTVASGTNRKLVLSASWESGNPGISATWNGTQNFTLAVSSANGRNSAVLYLDDPTPGTGNIVVTFPVATGSRVGVLSLVGAARGVARTSNSSGISGGLALPVDGSFVVGVYTSNNTPAITGPFSSSLYTGDSGSSAGNAGYQTMPTAGPANFNWSVTAPADDNHALAAFVPAAAAPVIITTSPADDAIGVLADANLVANFSEPVVKGTGTITIKRTSDNSMVESFNAATSPALTFSGQTLSINPTANLDHLTEYCVVIDATAVIDTTGGDAFAGISAPSAPSNWSFTTAPAIALLNTVNFTDDVQKVGVTTFTYTTTFDPDDAADALVLMLATEASAPSAVVSFGSQPMTQAVANPGNNPVAVYYLNNPSTLSQTISVTINITTGNINGIGFTMVALNNSDNNLGIVPTSAVTNSNTQSPLSIDINVPDGGSFVVAGYNNNSTNGTANVNSLLTLLHAGDFGNLVGAFGYEANVAAGSQTYGFTTTAAIVADFSAAVAFAAVPTPTNTFASWISNPSYGLAVGDQDFGDDPDGDGIENGVENYFGTNPGTFTPGLAASIKNGNRFTFTHPQNASPASAFGASYRWSTDLAAFHLGGETSGGTTVNFTTEANTPSSGFTRVTATVTGTLPGRLFVDVRVTGP